MRSCATKVCAPPSWAAQICRGASLSSSPGRDPVASPQRRETLRQPARKGGNFPQSTQEGGSFERIIHIPLPRESRKRGYADARSRGCADARCPGGAWHTGPRRRVAHRAAQARGTQGRTGAWLAGPHRRVACRAAQARGTQGRAACGYYQRPRRTFSTATAAGPAVEVRRIVSPSRTAVAPTASSRLRSDGAMPPSGPTTSTTSR